MNIRVHLLGPQPTRVWRPPCLELSAVQVMRNHYHPSVRLQTSEIQVVYYIRTQSGISEVVYGEELKYKQYYVQQGRKRHAGITRARQEIYRH